MGISISKLFHLFQLRSACQNSCHVNKCDPNCSLTHKFRLRLQSKALVLAEVNLIHHFTHINKCTIVYGYSSVRRTPAPPLRELVPYGITQYYMPPGRDDIPALTPAEAGTRLSNPGGMQG